MRTMYTVLTTWQEWFSVPLATSWWTHWLVQVGEFFSRL